MTLYQSFRWNRTAAWMLQHARPCVVAAQDSRGAAIIPAALEGQVVTLLGDALFDYRDVLSTGSAALAAAWREIASWGRPLSFIALRGDSPHGFWTQPEREPFCGAPSISLDDISAGDFARRHWRQAKQVRRLYREGARLLHRHGGDSALVRWIYEGKAARLANDPNNVFSDRSRIDFLLRMAADEGANCDVYGFEIDGVVIASLVTFRDHPAGAPRPVRRYYTTTFDARWARYSPGIALLYEVARQSLEEGMDVDFQTGEQFHKSRLATRSAPLYRVALTAEQVAAMAERLTGSARAAA